MLTFKFDQSENIKWSIVLKVFYNEKCIYKNTVKIISEFDFEIIDDNFDFSIFNEKDLNKEYNLFFKKNRSEIIESLYSKDELVISYKINGCGSRAGIVEHLVNRIYDAYNDSKIRMYKISKKEIINMLINDLNNLLIESVL